MKIRTKFLFISLFIVIIPALVTGSIYINNFQSKIQMIVEEDLRDMNSTSAYYVQDYVADQKHELEIMAQLKEFQYVLRYPDDTNALRQLNKDTVQGILKLNCSTKDDLLFQALVDKNNQVIATSTGVSEGTTASLSYDMSTVEEGSYIITNENQDTLDIRGPYIRINIPIYQDGNYAGYISQVVDLKLLDRYLSTAQKFDSGRIIVFRKTGEILATTEKKVNGENKEFFTDNKLGFWENKFKEDPYHGFVDYISKDGRRNGFYEYIGVLDAYVISTISWNEVHSTSQETLFANFMFILLFGIFCLVLSYYVFSNMWHPMKHLLKSIKEIANNNYKARFKYYGNDEFREIADAFNSLTETVERNQNEINSLISNVPGGVFKCAFDKKQQKWKYEFVSTGFLEIMKCPEENMEEILSGSIYGTMLEEDRQQVSKYLNENMKVNSELTIEYRVKNYSDEVIWISSRCTMLEEESCQIIYGVITDITHEKKIQEDLRQTERKNQMLIDFCVDITFEYDIEKDYMSFSEKMVTFAGLSTEMKDAKRMLLDEGMIFEEDIPAVKKFYYDLFEKDAAIAEIRFRHLDGSYHWVKLNGSPLKDKDGNVVKLIGVVSDINKEKEALKHFMVLSQLDMLTNVLNKTSTEKHINECIDVLSDKKHALLMMDIDDFKDINDTFGHIIGDSVLKEFTANLQRIFRTSDIIGRVGGDEFMVFMRDIKDVHIIEKKCNEILKLFKGEIMENLDHSSLSGSIGIALYPDDGSNYQDLYEKADKALYHAKKHGKSQYVYFNEIGNTIVKEENVITKKDVSKIDTIETFEGQLIKYVFRELYVSKNIDKTIEQILSVIGVHLKVSRAYIFENNEDDSEITNTYEWCSPGIRQMKDELQHVSIEQRGLLRNKYDDNGVFYLENIEDVKDNPVYYNFVASQDIKSMLHCSMEDNGVYKGFIGFDECTQNRKWTLEELDLLRIIANIITVFLMKYRKEN